MRSAAVALLAAAVLCAAPAARAATAVRIGGNAAISTKSLREAAAAELAELEDPARRRAGAADAAFQMESAGRRAGYAFIEVEHEISGEGAEAVVTFTVREGPLVRLGEVSFSGNAFFTAEELRPYFASAGPTPYVEADIGAGRRNLVQLYRDQGFPGVEIGKPLTTISPDRSVADVRLVIAEGTRFVISGVVFEGDALPEDGAALQGLASGLLGQPFYERRKLALGNAVTEVFSAQGCPDAAVVVREEPGAAAGDVVLRVSVASGPRVRISRVDVAGNKRTREKLILSRIPIKQGDWFNEEKLHEGFRALYRTGLFTRVDHALEGEGAERVLRVEVEEAPARELSGEIGWGSYERLRGGVGFKDRNVFGTGRGVGAEAGASTKGGRVKVEFLDPRFFDTEFSLSIPLTWSYREEPTYTEEEVELSVRLYRLLARRVTAGLQYSFRFNGLSQLSPDVPPDARDEEYTAASLKANLDVDRRDNFFYPSRGWKTGLAVELADQRLGGTLDFVRCTAGASLVQPLGAGFVLGLRLDTGFILPTRGNENVPVNERFYTGGDSSVRSFEEQQLGPKGPSGDPLGGLASTVAGVELRRQIVRKLAASVFADFGNVSPNRSLAGLDPDESSTADQVDAMWGDYLKDFRAGIGFGLQYITPVGPVRLDLAWNPDPRPEEDEADYAWHFSFGMAF
jgi:outer membrane protein assembly complex protein YaeT